MEKIVVRGRVGLFNEKTSVKLVEHCCRDIDHGNSLTQLYRTKKGKYVLVDRHVKFLSWIGAKKYKEGNIWRAQIISKEEAINYYNDTYTSFFLTRKKFISCPELDPMAGLKEI